MADIRIKYFLEIVNNGCNFTKASQALFVSQPALSYHVLSLGKELGVKLFDTANKSSVKLTPGGKLFYEFFTAHEKAFCETILEAKKLNAIPEHELQIACNIGWDMTEVLDAIGDFRLRHQNVNVNFDSVSYKQMESGFQNNHYDIIIAAQRDFENIETLNTKVVYITQWVLLYSTKHKLSQKEKPVINDFKDEIFYETSKDERHSARDIHEKYCKEHGFIPVIKELPNLDSIFLAIETGAGCAMLENRTRICKNIAYKFFELDIKLEIGFVWKKKNSNPALNLFIDEVVAPFLPR
jgi:DNA-binding transcriptional LysR family regulator